TERDKDAVAKGGKTRELPSDWRAVKSTAERLLFGHGYGVHTVGLTNNLILGIVMVRVDNAQSLRDQERLLASKPDIPSAIYYDDYERLLARFPGIDTPVDSK